MNSLLQVYFGRFFPQASARCRCSAVLWKYELEQSGHWNGLIPLCLFMCPTKCPRIMKPWEHTSHTYLKCLRWCWRMWMCSPGWELNVRLQSEHCHFHVAFVSNWVWLQCKLADVAVDCRFPDEDLMLFSAQSVHREKILFKCPLFKSPWFHVNVYFHSTNSCSKKQSQELQMVQITEIIFHDHQHKKRYMACRRKSLSPQG